MTVNKKSNIPRYIAFNDKDEEYTTGSEVDVLEDVAEWLNQEHISEHNITVFKLGEKIEFEAKPIYKVRLKLVPPEETTRWYTSQGWAPGRIDRSEAPPVLEGFIADPMKKKQPRSRKNEK